MPATSSAIRRRRGRVSSCAVLDAAAAQRGLADRGARPANERLSDDRRACPKSTRSWLRSSARPGSPSSLRGRACRQAHAAREQGIAGHVGPAVHASRARGRGHADADRQRAQRDLPVHAAHAHGRCRGRAPRAAHGLGRAVPAHACARIDACHARSGLRASALASWAARSPSIRQR